jgi:hypothetical protein
MTDEFILQVIYKEEERNLAVQLLLQGYTHKFKVMVDQMEVFFEPDEEGYYRAVKMSWQNEQDFLKIDKNMLQAIQKKLEAILAG